MERDNAEQRLAMGFVNEARAFTLYESSDRYYEELDRNGLTIEEEPQTLPEPFPTANPEKINETDTAIFYAAESIPAGQMNRARELMSDNGGSFLEIEEFASTQGEGLVESFQAYADTNVEVISSQTGIPIESIQARVGVIELGNMSMKSYWEYVLPDGSRAIPYVKPNEQTLSVFVFTPEENHYIGAAAVSVFIRGEGNKTKIVPASFYCVNGETVPATFPEILDNGEVVETPFSVFIPSGNTTLVDEQGNTLPNQQITASDAIGVLDLPRPILPTTDYVEGYVLRSEGVIEQNARVQTFSVDIPDLESNMSLEQISFNNLPEEYKARINLPEGDANRIEYSEEMGGYIDNQGRVYRPETTRPNNPEAGWAVEMTRETFNLVDKNGVPFTWTVTLERTAEEEGLGETGYKDVEFTPEFRQYISDFASSYLTSDGLNGEIFHITAVRHYERSDADVSFENYLQSRAGYSDIPVFGWNNLDGHNFARLNNIYLDGTSGNLSTGTATEADESLLSNDIAVAFIIVARDQQGISGLDTLEPNSEFTEMYRTINPSSSGRLGFHDAIKLIKIVPAEISHSS